MFNCFAVFELSSGARLLKSTSRCENRFELRTPGLFAFTGCESDAGIFGSDGASLASLFKPGIMGAVADLINDMDRPRPRDTLRRSRSRSSVRTRLRLGRCLAGTGRLVAAPGREVAPEKLADLASFAFGGDATTGPPNLVLIIAHRSGRRAEKLY